MAGVRGVRNPKPKSGGSPTGIFSTKGSQKRDPLSATQQKYAAYAGNNGDKARKKPVTRNNGLK